MTTMPASTAAELESDTSVDLGTNGRQPSPQALKTEPEASQSAVSQCPMCGKSFGPRFIYWGLLSLFG